MATKKDIKSKDIKNNESKFTKEQILKSKKYANRRDALGAILSDDGNYTLNDVETLLEGFMKGKVN